MGKREGSDGAHVVDLCNRVLGETALTQHTFDWLLGDAGVGGRRAGLPVDASWPGHQLVVEYRELQRHRPVPHFDKPDQLTVSGVHRGEQRALYDARRESEIPAHGLRLLVIRPRRPRRGQPWAPAPQPGGGHRSTEEDPRPRQ
ncbi:hypothetical protein [Streptomyces sp. NPDC001978]|uniref:hypothetical protein n=1 Tax=Streptomyces sp. NPDC001978 TaxID=3364627 RepID=UPI0036937D2A